MSTINTPNTPHSHPDGLLLHILHPLRQRHRRGRHGGGIWGPVDLHWLQFYVQRRLGGGAFLH